MLRASTFSFVLGLEKLRTGPSLHMWPRRASPPAHVAIKNELRKT